MKAESIRRAAVIGAGTMGHGIAQALASCGIATVLCDVSREQVERGLARIRANLDKGVERGKVDASARDQTAFTAAWCSGRSASSSSTLSPTRGRTP